MRIRRHDIDHVCTFVPRDTPSNPEVAYYYRDWDEVRERFYTPVDKGWNQTSRQKLHELNFKGQSRFGGRMDVLLENVNERCGECGHDTKTRSITVDFGPEGTLTGDVHHFSAQDVAWALEESARCWEVAQADPIVMKMWFQR